MHAATCVVAMMKTTLVIQSCLQRAKAGDPQAREELIARFSARLREMARRMVLARHRIARADQFEVLIREAANRLESVLATLTPASVDEFFRLGAVHLRSELRRLANDHLHPAETDVSLNINQSDANTTSEMNPSDRPTLPEEADTWAQWLRFHIAAEKLPELEKRTFDLLWYHGLTQAEAAEVLGVSERQIKRNWNSARLILKSFIETCVDSE